MRFTTFKSKPSILDSTQSKECKFYEVLMYPLQRKFRYEWLYQEKLFMNFQLDLGSLVNWFRRTLLMQVPTWSAIWACFWMLLRSCWAREAWYRSSWLSTTITRSWGTATNEMQLISEVLVSLPFHGSFYKMEFLGYTALNDSIINPEAWHMWDQNKHCYPKNKNTHTQIYSFNCIWHMLLVITCWLAYLFNIIPSVAHIQMYCGQNAVFLTCLSWWHKPVCFLRLRKKSLKSRDFSLF
jgi:hypothetical protein